MALLAREVEAWSRAGEIETARQRAPLIALRRSALRSMVVLAVCLQLGGCVDDAREAIERAVKVELGDDAKIDVDDDDDPRAVLVRVECAIDGASAGVVIEGWTSLRLAVTIPL